MSELFWISKSGYVELESEYRKIIEIIDGYIDESSVEWIWLLEEFPEIKLMFID